MSNDITPHVRCNTQCNTLLHTTTHYSTPKRTATHCYTLQRTVIHCNVHTATYSNTLQHTATHCKPRFEKIYRYRYHPACEVQHTATRCYTLQHTATHCNTLQHTATHCKTWIGDIYRCHAPCGFPIESSQIVRHCTEASFAWTPCACVYKRGNETEREREIQRMCVLKDLCIY